MRLLARWRPALNSQGLLNALSQLSDEDWADVIIRSAKDLSYVGFKLPRVADLSVQRRYNTGTDSEHNLHSGFNFYRIVKSYTERCGRPLGPDSRVLDFGCGWGRVIRFFLKDVRGENLYGIDVDRLAIRVCRRDMVYGSYSVNRRWPPTKFAANTFDLVYAFSVFSHLPEDLHLRWVEELARILKPGGLLVVTTLGRSFIRESIS